jgi:hypothetical protein
MQFDASTAKTCHPQAVLLLLQLPKQDWPALSQTL